MPGATASSTAFCTRSLSATRSATCAPAHTRQSLPDPHDDAGSSTGSPTSPASTAPRSVVTRTPAAGSARSTASSHAGPSCHQCPNSSVSNAATVSAGRPPLAQRQQPLADHATKSCGVALDGRRGPRRVVGPLVLRRDRAAGHPGRLEAGGVVVGVEVAVVAPARVAGARRPDPVGDLEVAAERQHVRVADRAGERGVAAQRRPVDEEPRDPGPVVLRAMPGA